MKNGIHKETKLINDLLVHIKTPYVNGKKEGIQKQYTEEFNGDLLLYKEVTFINDKKEGIGKKYFEDGTLQQEVNFVND